MDRRKFMGNMVAAGAMALPLPALVEDKVPIAKLTTPTYDGLTVKEILQLYYETGNLIWQSNLATK